MTRLIVFSDDWGRHPSSCQHLIRTLVDRYPVTWVNTIGMRRPGLSRPDVAKMVQRLRQWTGLHRSADGSAHLPANLSVLTPLMWPGFHHAWERALNGALVGRALHRALDELPRGTVERRVVLTTLPIAAALLDRLRVDATVYYCVDDFSSWPGHDSRVMRELEQRLLQRADRVVAASSVLQAALAADGREVTLLTHGVDVAHWNGGGAPASSAPQWARALRRPIVMFWGLVDRRLDVSWLRALQDPQLGTAGSLVLIGPRQGHDPALAALDGVVLPGPVPYDALPQVAALADVLVMPYVDSAATRAMQPLKLKEYLATRKPVIARDLPALRGWADAADVVGSAEAFARAAAARARSGAPETQLRARQRLVDESWARKARELEALLAGSL